MNKEDYKLTEDAFGVQYEFDTFSYKVLCEICLGGFLVLRENTVVTTRLSVSRQSVLKKETVNVS